MGDERFRVNARNFFLTYPRCDQPSQELLAFLCGLKSTWIYVTVGEECHQDGTPHRHALVSLSKKWDVRSAQAFDWRGYHPNVQAARDLSAVLAYVHKENAFVEAGDRPGIKKTSWDCVVQADNAVDALELIRSKHPRDYVLNLERIEYFLEKRFKKIKPLL